MPYIEGMFGKVWVNDVEVSSIYNVQGSKIKDWKLLHVKGNPSKYYTVVSGRYAPLSHRQVVEMTKEAIDRAGFDIKKEDIIVEGKYGARMFYKVIVDEFEVKENDKIALGIMITNSYDKDMGIYMSGYGLRLVCLNEMVFGREILGEYTIHVGEVRRRFQERLSDLLENMQDVQVFLRRMLGLNMGANEVMWLLSRLKLANKYVRSIKRYLGIDGRTKGIWNVWEVYNAITYAITHRAFTMSYERRVELLKKLNSEILRFESGEFEKNMKRLGEVTAQILNVRK